MNSTAHESTRRVTFKVTTTIPLPAGQQVFVAGGAHALGSWRPDGFPLARTEDHVWRGSVDLPTGRPVEFKVTRGTWSSEQVLADDSVPPNGKIVPEADATVDIPVQYWKDHLPEPPPQITGAFRIHYGVRSEFLRYNRRVIVWLPPSYEQKPDRRYPVLYMHDGQQVFDPQTSTWKQALDLDDWCTDLIEQDKIHEVIVVAIYSTPDRELEYDPDQLGENYNKFVISELKPFIDAEYRTQPGARTTMTAGASMGGTMAFCLAWKHSDVFSAAACLSPAFKFKDAQHCLDAVRRARQVPPVSLFLYCGNGDDLERKLMTGMREMADGLREKGFRDGGNLLVIEHEDGEHNEASWTRVTGEWLTFLLGVS